MESKVIYVGMVIEATEELLDYQETFCRQFNLIPRPELHVSVGFLGEMTVDSIEALGAELAFVCDDELRHLTCTGIGGAAELPTGDLALLDDTTAASDVSNQPRVLWLAVDATPSLLKFRNSLISYARTLGLDTQYLRPMFTPHITLGSNGPLCKGVSYELWDVHEIEKTPSIERFPVGIPLRVERVHLTDVDTHPDSVRRVSAW